MDTKRYILARRLCWCRTVIRHEAMKAKRKYDRWRRETLLLNTENESGHEVIDIMENPDSQKEFNDKELQLLLTSLPLKEYIVLYHLFYLYETEKVIAEYMRISQQQVNRIKKRALTSLRQEAIEHGL